MTNVTYTSTNDSVTLVIRGHAVTRVKYTRTIASVTRVIQGTE